MWMKGWLRHLSYWMKKASNPLLAALAQRVCRSRLVTKTLFVAALHFSLWWACAGFLKVTGFELFTLPSLFGFGPPPKHTALQETVFILQGTISYPAALLPFWGEGVLEDVLVLATNSMAWGLCFALGIWAWSRNGVKSKYASACGR